MAEITPFGIANGGVPVQAIHLRATGIRATVLTWGAVLQGVWLDGVAHGLTLGSDSLADYEGAMRHHGSVIAPVANRIGGARADVAGQDCRFDANQASHICLHSGWAGTHRRNWRLVEASEATVTLVADLPSGEGGFPGARRIEARYALSPGVLRLHLRATTDAPTLMNIAHHGYWNLDGSPTFTGHRLQIAADHYLPTDADVLPTGEVRGVGGTEMDFRTAREIAPDQPPLDTCFCLADRRGPLREVLWLTGASGLSMALATTEPGVQVYDACEAIRPGRGWHEGLAIEPQLWPDAPRHPGFPPITLAPGQSYEAVSEWRFSRR